MATQLNCPGCGARVLPTFRHCPSCHTPLAGAGMQTPVALSASAQPRPVSGVWQGSPAEPAAHWRRVLAILIDMALLALPSVLAAKVLPLLGALLVPWLYFSWFEASGWQGTPGKRLMINKNVLFYMELMK